MSKRSNGLNSKNERLQKGEKDNLMYNQGVFHCVTCCVTLTSHGITTRDIIIYYITNADVGGDFNQNGFFGGKTKIMLLYHCVFLFFSALLLYQRT